MMRSSIGKLRRKTAFLICAVLVGVCFVIFKLAYFKSSSSMALKAVDVHRSWYKGDPFDTGKDLPRNLPRLNGYHKIKFNRPIPKDDVQVPGQLAKPKLQSKARRGDSLFRSNDEDEKAARNFKMMRILNRELRKGIRRGGQMLLKVGDLHIQSVDRSFQHRQWQRQLGDRENYELDSMGELPKKFRPEIGNGHLAAVVFSDQLHVNGMYIGTGRESKRALFPTIIIRNITDVHVNGEALRPLLRRYSLNVAEGVFTQIITGPGLKLEQRIYAHRNFTPLLVHEIDVRAVPLFKPPLKQMTIQVKFDADGVNTGDSDASLTEETYPHLKSKSFKHRSGYLHEPEDEKMNTRQPNRIHLISTELPGTLTAQMDVKNDRVKWNFLLSVCDEEATARHFFEVGLQLIKQGDWLYLTHLDSWREVWNSGRIQAQLESSESHFPKILLSAQYYILTSLPWRPHKGYSFSGLSPGGLAHGNKEEVRSFQGHTYWDQDMWMFPPIMMLHPKLARLSMLAYRIEHMPRARLNAKAHGYKGVMFPWESGFTGKELTKDLANALYQHHGTGAVALAAVNYILATNDTEFLHHEGGEELILDVARFWKSRLTSIVVRHRTEYGKIIPEYRYETWNAMGPDEYHERVNNSAYTNAMARFCLEAPARIRSFVSEKSTEEMMEMKKMAKNIYIPFDPVNHYHPEFDGYKKGEQIKQADTVLLGYPLHYAFDHSVRRNDLSIYEQATSNGPGMTWGMHAIGWLELKKEDKAWSAFKQQFMHVRKPFKVWSEYVTGGRTNFLTAAGGFLQSVLNGYFGLRLKTSGLYFDAVVPFKTKNVSIIGLNYLGNTIDVIVTDDLVKLRCTGFDPQSLPLETEILNVTPRPIPLVPRRWIKLLHGRGVIRAIPGASRRPVRLRLASVEVVPEVVDALKAAAAISSKREAEIAAWRKKNEELVRLRNKKLKLVNEKSKHEEPIERAIAKKLRRKAEKKAVKQARHLIKTDNTRSDNV